MHAKRRVSNSTAHLGDTKGSTQLSWNAGYIWGIIHEAWYVESRLKIGYQNRFTCHFHELLPLCTPGADILALEQETEGLLDENIGGGFL